MCSFTCRSLIKGKLKRSLIPSKLVLCLHHKWDTFEGLSLDRRKYTQQPCAVVKQHNCFITYITNPFFIINILRMEKQIASIWTLLLCNLMRQFKEKDVSVWRCLWSHNNHTCCITVICASCSALNVLIHSFTLLELHMRDKVSEYTSFDQTAGVWTCFLLPFILDDYAQASSTLFHRVEADYDNRL